MPKKPIERSRTLGPELRRRREELNLTLRDVVRETEETGRPIPFSTLAKIEKGEIEPGVLRLHQLLKLYHVPMQAAQDLLDLEEVAGDLPEILDPERTYAEGRERWMRGDIGAGMAYFLALRQHLPKSSPLRVKATLAFTAACENLGKYRLAKLLLEDLLLEPIPVESRVTAYVQMAMAWDALGSADVALAFLDRGEAHLRSGDAENRAWLSHKKAGVLVALGRHDEARRQIDRAARAYRAAGDRAGALQMAGLRARVLRETGDVARALAVARRARREAERLGHERIAYLRALDEAVALVLLGRFDPAIGLLQTLLARALRNQDRAVQFYGHFWLARAHDGLGMADRARTERDAARYFARFVDQSSPEILEIMEDDHDAEDDA